MQTVLHPLGESLDEEDLHELNDPCVVHADGSLKELSPIVKKYVQLDDYWTNHHRSSFNELFADGRACILSYCTRIFLNEFPCWCLEVETGRSGAALDATLEPLQEMGFLFVEEGEDGENSEYRRGREPRLVALC